MLGVVPSQQRFDAERGAGPQRDERLVAEGERFALDGATEGGLELEAADGIGLVTRLVELEPFAALDGGGHGELGAADELIGVERRAVGDRDTDGGVDGEVGEGGGERLGEEGHEATRDVGRHELGTRLPSVGLEDHAEGGGVDPRDEVNLAQAGAQTGGGGAEHLVADQPSEAVADESQVAHLEHEDGHRGGGAPGALQHPRELAVEDLSADEPGQQVVGERRGVGEVLEVDGRVGDGAAPCARPKVFHVARSARLVRLQPADEGTKGRDFTTRGHLATLRGQRPGARGVKTD